MEDVNIYAKRHEMVTVQLRGPLFNHSSYWALVWFETSIFKQKAWDSLSLDVENFPDG